MIKDLFELFFTFFKIGSITFGGGLAMLPILEKELVEKRHWTESEELLDYYAIAQSTPGIIAVNVATFIGHKRRGILGGTIATLGIVCPSVIIITLIAVFISNFEDILWVKKALLGINVAVAALLTYSVVGLCKKTLKKWWSVIVFAGAFTAVYFFHVHSIFVVLGAAVLGILYFFIWGRKAAQVAAAQESSGGEAGDGNAVESTASSDATGETTDNVVAAECGKEEQK